MKTGIYIHIPFCVSKCNYCDFLSFSNKENQMEDYTKSLCEEIRKCVINETIQTIFIGGGTPTVLPIQYMEMIIEAVMEKNIESQYEFTVEANPDTVDEKYLQRLLKLGVNRLSFGLQSCNDEILKKLGRTHSYEVFLNKFLIARKVGFNNINVDLMYTLPGQTVADFKETLEKIVKLKPEPEHISAYSLIIEEGTVFFNLNSEKKLKLPTEEEDILFNKLCCDVLRENDYYKYEVSNYSKKGYECKHNIIYWELDNYYGFGLNAHSKIYNERKSNTASLDDYLIENKKNEVEVLSKEMEIEEFVFLGLRMTKGINMKKFKEKFDLDFYEIYGEKIEDLVLKGLLVKNNDDLFATENGFNVLNYVIEKLLL
ncbi:MAG: radical SAM family heme chaperone HemW [Lachnospirales bacterium]